MTEFLIKRFIKDSENVTDPSVRLSYGILSGIIGIICNIFLFSLKVFIGLSVHSISIISDGFNNLSDSLSSVVTLVGYKIASKPADKEHPFGHGRMEYIVSFIVSCIIFLMGFELLSSSFDKIIHPEEVIFSWISFFVLAASISIKIWLSRFNYALGYKTNNLAMMAVSEDASNDVIATSVTLLALLLSLNYSIPFDGIAGIFVSLFVFYSGYGISKEIINKILGDPIDQDTAKSIEELILSHDEILGMHDLLLHDYGPEKLIGTVHIELDSKTNFMEAHEISDKIEKEVLDKLGISITVHADPYVKDDPERELFQKEIQRILKEIAPDLSIHDFQIYEENNEINLDFDIVIPFQSKISRDLIQQRIDDMLARFDKTIHTSIHYDHEFISKETPNK